MSEPRNITIGVESAPFYDDPDYAPAFYDAIGRVVVLWGRAEQHLDFALIMACGIARDHGIEAEPPRGLKAKTKLLRSLFYRCLPLQRMQEPVKRLSLDFDNVAGRRNILIHSNMGGFEDGPPPKLLLHNVWSREDRTTFGLFKLQLEQIVGLAATIDKLNTRMLGLTFFLVPIQSRRARAEADVVPTKSD